ncbi:MAG: polysaccharide deacetylase family protein [Betaproteobacteria bacterium]|nr:polysaccharide deacetylase family protein [Betaproteobacteria bacterium]MDH3436475.1 polysaccharide deacetylase family protein [Betaproteobacteria bacterium]
MADALERDPHTWLTTSDLTAVYRKLIDVFDRFDIPATWAFVAAFAHREEEVRDCPYLVENPLLWRDGDWTASFRAALQSGNADGWMCPAALEIVASSGRHEIASHGFSHVPLAENLIEAQVFDREMIELSQFWGRRGVRPTTFVFPRNQPGYLERLGSAGFEAYRPPAKLERQRNQIARLCRLAGEFNVLEKPENHGRSGTPGTLPPAILLNHRAGGRRFVPMKITLERVRRLLDNAITTRRVVHLYSHPHNFLTGDHQLELLCATLQLVSERVKQARMRVMTQATYARDVLGSA